MKLGFIGCGNMATAIAKGIISKGIVTPENIYGSNHTLASTQRVARELGINTTTNNLEVVAQADIVFLSVKPQQFDAVIDQIKNEVRPAQIVVTMSPGKTISWFEEAFGKPLKLVRTAPNTPALVGAGITAYCENSLVTEEELQVIEQLLSSFGNIVHLKESLLDVVSVVGGSSPAYVYMFIEALADGAVAEGLPRAQAYEIASQAVLGSAKMVLESGKHPAQLKDEVCSPGGSTIVGVQTLENAGFGGAVISAIRDCAARARQL